MKARIALILSLSPLLAGCPALFGDRQEVLFETDPNGATCYLTRGGLAIAQFQTPASVTLERTSRPVTIECAKPGLAPVKQVLPPGLGEFTTDYSIVVDHVDSLTGKPRTIKYFKLSLGN